MLEDLWGHCSFFLEFALEALCDHSPITPPNHSVHSDKGFFYPGALDSQAGGKDEIRENYVNTGRGHFGENGDECWGSSHNLHSPFIPTERGDLTPVLNLQV